MVGTEDEEMKGQQGMPKGGTVDGKLRIFRIERSSLSSSQHY